MKVNAFGDFNCQGSRLFNFGSYTNNNQLMNGFVANSRYLRKDSGDIDLNGLRLLCRQLYQ